MRSRTSTSLRFIQEHWKSNPVEEVPVAECLFYERSVLRTGRQYRLHCTEDALELAPVGNEAAGLSKDRLVWTDILGAYRFSALNSMESSASLPSSKLVKKMKSSMKDQDFVLFACVPKNRLKKNKKTKPIKRIQVQWVFRYTGDNENKYLEKLLASIQFLSDPRVYGPESTLISPEILKKVQDVDLNASEPILPKRKFLIVINPVGGAGRGKEIYHEQVSPIFKQSGIECEEIITQRQAHATEIMSKIPLNHYDCIVSVGGDGLLSEIVQGLMGHEDWEQAIRQPLGVIPGGSGNGLSASFLVRSNEELEAVNAAFSVAKGTVQKLDLATMRNTKGEKMYSFLSLEWAFIADVDIESEKYRQFGDLRFTISAVQKLLFSRKAFTGTLHYLPEEYTGKQLQPVSDVIPESEKQKKNGPRLDLLESIPSSEWKELSGHFDLFWGMNVSHAAKDAIVAPQAIPDDGLMHLVILHGPLKRSKLISVMLAMETGQHVNKKLLTLIKTRAFKLQVINPKDRLCVDGELVTGPEIQVEMHQQLGRIVALPSFIVN